MKSDSLKKAIAQQQAQGFREQRQAKDDRVIREESNDRYRDFLSSINKTADRDAERALRAV